MQNRKRASMTLAAAVLLGAASSLLAVPPPDCGPDMTGDGQVTIGDLFTFLNAYFAQSATADYNRADGVTVQDVFDYLVGYFAGCP